MQQINVTITHLNGEVIQEPYGDTARCDNCGKPSNKAESCIVGGYLCDEEWACCEKCYDEMVEKGCAFEELGDMTYRRQKY